MKNTDSKTRMFSTGSVKPQKGKRFKVTYENSTPELNKGVEYNLIFIVKGY